MLKIRSQSNGAAWNRPSSPNSATRDRMILKSRALNSCVRAQLRLARRRSGHEHPSSIHTLWKATPTSRAVIVPLRCWLRWAAAAYSNTSPPLLCAAWIEADHRMPDCTEVRPHRLKGHCAMHALWRTQARTCADCDNATQMANSLSASPAAGAAAVFMVLSNCYISASAHSPDAACLAAGHGPCSFAWLQPSMHARMGLCDGRHGPGRNKCKVG